MPDRHYLRQPPLRLRDHVLAHPGTVVTAWSCVVISVYLMVDMLIIGWAASPSLVALPEWVKGIMSIFFFVGGLMAWIGLVWRPHRADLSWALERAGWTIIISASLAFIFALATTDPPGLLEVLPVTWIAIGLIRIIALRAIEKRERRNQAVVKSLRIV